MTTTNKPATTTPKIEVDPIEATLKKLRSAKKLIHRAAIEMSDVPTLTKAEGKAMAALAEIQIALDEIKASKQGVA